MKFGRDDNANSGAVEDRRGFPGGGIGMAGGGLGVVGVVLYLIVRALGGDVTTDQRPRGDETARPSPTTATSTNTTSATLGGSCEGVTSANDDAKFIACVQTNVQKFWQSELGKQGRNYQNANLVLFTDRTRSGCGGADAAMGPFYCPTDSKVYLDLGFFKQLRSRLGAKGGDFAEAYVVAHEYAHHVQALLGTERRAHDQMARDPRNRNATSVRLELQADCLAGVWGHSAYGAGKVDASEINDALDAAGAVGDDRIQRASRGTVHPESFTHGSSAERQRWFDRGMKSGSVEACDTFGG